MWKELGVEVGPDGATVTLNNDAPMAAIRRAIEMGTPEPPRSARQSRADGRLGSRSAKELGADGGCAALGGVCRANGEIEVKAGTPTPRVSREL